MIVPPLGSVLRLTQDWSFSLKHEYRNHKLHQHFGTPERRWDMVKREYIDPDPVVTLPADTLLKLDRIYVRKGVGDYDSLTFYIKARHKGDLAARFFASLTDCNKMEYEWV